jgi:hypothetical protein
MRHEVVSNYDSLASMMIEGEQGMEKGLVCLNLYMYPSRNLSSSVSESGIRFEDCICCSTESLSHDTS